MSWLLEDPTPIYWMLGVLALALLCAVIVTKRLLYVGFAGLLLLLAGGVWLVDYLVLTDHEAVTEACHQLAEAAERADIDRIAELLTPDCSASMPVPVLGFEANNRDQVLGHARAHLPRQGSRQIKVWVVDISSSRDGRSHTCHCDIRASGDFGSYSVNFALVKADFTFTKSGDGRWRVRHMLVRSAQ